MSIHGDEYLCILIMHSPKPHLRLQDHEKILLHVYDDKINNVSIILHEKRSIIKVLNKLTVRE